MREAIHGEVPKNLGSDQRWRIEKTISYSDIITTIAMIATAVSLFISADRRIEQNAADIRILARVQEENDRRQDDLRARIETSLDNIDRKMDWVISRLVESKTK